MSEQTGPSMSTEPGWMAARHTSRLLLGELVRPRPQNDPSMLLSFERPAPAGPREVITAMTCKRAVQPALHASPRSLKTAQKPHQPSSISDG